ncbi:MAG: flavin reductase family protein [Leptospiraceae bacterium]|nr:flavin reductase family protein [Leptospiraceae bacterium]
MAITKDDFKKAMGHWASGVTIVTYSENGIYSGLTASSFTSLSVDPFPCFVLSFSKKLQAMIKFFK